MAILLSINQWAKPSLPSDDAWEKLTRQLIELYQDNLATAFAEKSAASPWRVIPPRAVLSRLGGAGGDHPPLELGVKCNAGAVLVGAVNGKGQLSLQLLEVPSGELLWGMDSRFTYQEGGLRYALDFPSEDIPKVVRGVAQALARVNEGRSLPGTDAGPDPAPAKTGRDDQGK